MEKFRYAPGMPGYGSKGTDGSIGLSGLAIYATDFTATSALGITGLTTRIYNNQSLFSAEPAPYINGYDTGRRYQNGDLFVDNTAELYVIDFSTGGDPWRDTTITLGGGTNIFTSHGVFNIGGKDYTRYANVGSAGETQPKLVDTYISPTVTDYINEKGPYRNYNIDRSQFGHIYFNDIPITGISYDYNAFNLWSAAETPGAPGVNDADAISLIRTTVDNNWRFGNTDTTGAIRTSAGPTLSLDFNKISIGKSTTLGPPTVALEIIGDVSVSGLLRATSSINLVGGALGSIPYQSALSTTQFLAAGTNGYFLKMVAGLPSWENVPPSGVQTLSTTTPIRNTGTSENPNVGIYQSTTSADGYLSSTDWNTFNGKANSNQSFFIGTTSYTIDRPSGSQTLTGISIDGNAATVTNGVYTSGDQTIGGTKTFSSTISANISGNAATVTGGVYTSGDQTIAGTKTFSSTIAGSVTGNAGTVTNGVYTTGSYANPAWITSLAAAKLTGFTGIDGGGAGLGPTQIRVGTSFSGTPVDGDLWIDTN